MDSKNFIYSSSAFNNAQRYKDAQSGSKFTRVFNNKSMVLYPENGLLTFRKKFECIKDIKKVVLKSSALGIYDLYFNGHRVGERVGDDTLYDELKPGWTDYRFRVFEHEYDVTEFVAKQNEVISQVSIGWWSGRISFGAYGYKQVAFCSEIVITYCDDSTETIVTDNSWDVTVCGPVMFADIYDGEYYDARIIKPWQDSNSYTWNKADHFDYDGVVEKAKGPSIHVRNNLSRKPLSATVYNGTVDNKSLYGKINVISEKHGESCEQTLVKKGESIILDMGQNMVGRPHFVIKAKAGTKITGYCAEFLNDSGNPERGNDGPMGSMYIMNYRRALARVVYISNGADSEDYHPTFTFYGFRYYELTADDDFELISFVGEVIGSDMVETSDVVTSDDEVNKLVSNIRWGARGNYLSVPTDCPQRDERLGWTGDTQIFCRAGSYLMDNGEFMRKWLQDIRDSQYDPGDDNNNTAYCCVVPRVFMNGAGNQAAWGDAGIIVPWKVYEMYGDKSLLEEHYDSMEKYFKGLDRYGLRGPRPTYGDWLNYAVTPSEYLSTCYYYYDADLLSKMSSVLEKNDRASYYEDKKAKIREYWANLYMDGKKLNIDTQTAYLLPIAFGMVDGEEKSSFVSELSRLIIENDYTLSTGFVGTGLLCQTLAECGLDSLAYDLLLQTKDPSWLYSVRQGATTVWERWNSYTIEKGFGDVGMNSFNHYAYGAVYEWMMGYMVGIRPDTTKPGFEHFVLDVRPDFRTKKELPCGQKNITSASGYYDCAFGRISSSWNTEKGFAWNIDIPEGTSATVSYPSTSDRNFICVNGEAISLENLGATKKNGKIVFELKSGKYNLR